MKIAKVFVNQPLKQIDKPYDYLCPDKIKPGMRVALTFSHGKQPTDGMVIAVSNRSDYEGEIKPVLEVIDDEPVLRPYQIRLCQMMARRYCCRFYDCLSWFTAPVKLKKPTAKSEPNTSTFRAYHSSEIFFHLTESGEKAQTKGKVMRRILDFLKQGDASSSEIRRMLGDVSASLRSIESKGWAERYSLDIGDPFYPSFLPLWPDDVKFCGVRYKEIINQRLQMGLRPVYLCGNDRNCAETLILRIAYDTLSASGKALIIIPQVEMRRRLCRLFEKIFGRTGAVYSASVPQKEKYRIFAGIKNGRIRIVLGNMSAMFLPFDRLDDIMICEQNDDSFFSESSPHFRAFDIINYLSVLNGSKLTIYESIPSVECYYACTKRLYKVIDVSRKEVETPSQLIDMKKEMVSGNLSVFSRCLMRCMSDTINNNRHVLLLFNRRGYGSYIFCRDCGQSVKCPICETILKTASDGSVFCPTCSYRGTPPDRCPVCGSEHCKSIGTGIEQIEEQLKRKFTHVVRIEGERSLSKRKKLSAYEFEHPTVFLGTQALLGYEMSDVGLAAALLIDVDLNAGKSSDIVNFQMYKRFLDKSEGKKIIQTYMPEHPVNIAMTTQNSRSFYVDELFYRKSLSYPPFGTFYYISCFGTDENRVAEDSLKVHDTLCMVKDETVLTPVYHGKRAGTGDAEYHILIKTKNPDRTAEHIRQALSSRALSGLYAKTTVFVNPPWGV